MRYYVVAIPLLLAACNGEAPTAGELPAEAASPEPREGDPFRRVRPEELAPSLDVATLDCDGDGWFVVAEVAGRVASARAVIVGTGEDPLALDFPLENKPLPGGGGPWQRFEWSFDDPAVRCDRTTSATVIEGLDAEDRVVTCVAFGPGAAEVVAGAFDDRLAGVERGDWSRCKVR